MHDADALLARVVAQARALNIPVSSHILPQVRINRRAVTRFGCCIHQRDGSCLIELSARLLEASEQACLQTLAHEVLHTCPGCGDHGRLWRAYAGRMNAAWGYHIARTGDRAALGVAPPGEARYLVVCSRCGQRFERYRASPLVQHPERYRCRCGGRLERKF